MKKTAIILSLVLSTSLAQAAEYVACDVVSMSSSGKILNYLKGSSSADGSIVFTDTKLYNTPYTKALGQVAAKSSLIQAIALEITMVTNERISLEQVIVAPGVNFKTTVKTSMAQISINCSLVK